MSVIPRVVRPVVWLCVATTLATPLIAQEHSSEHGKLSLSLSLMVLVSASRERFRPVMTYRVDMRPGSDSWYEVKFNLEGAELCRVYQHPTLVYRCEWDRRTKLVELAAQLQQALGADWKRSASEQHGKSIRWEHRNAPVRNPVIEVSESARSIRFTMYAPDRGE